MIFRRIKAHVEKENWFAVGIDFVIVVIGVFIGIQVANWNEARSDRARENAFLERLYEDVEQAQLRLASFVKIREARLDAIMRIEDMYFGETAIARISESDCDHLTDSHIITYPAVEVPSITEAFTGGRIDLVTDPGLVRALIEVEQHEDRLRTAIEAMNRTPVVLHRLFPNNIFIVRGTAPEDLPMGSDWPRYNAGARCDLSGLENDPAFLSEIAIAMTLTSSYVGFLRAHAERLDGVITALDGEADKGVSQ
jgi:hypothetical protein